jgi:hypothetical protein
MPEETPQPPPPEAPQKKRWRRPLIIIAGSLLILAGLTTLLNRLFQQTRTSTETYSETLEQLVINSDNGDVTIVTTQSEGVTVERTERYSFRLPKGTAEIDGTTLTLDEGCPGFFSIFLGRCRVDFRIEAPAGVEVTVNLSNGEIDVDGIGGGVSLNSSNGRITGRSLVATVLLADTSNGDIELVFTSAPERVVAETSNGDIEIVVPDHSYKIEAETSNGSIEYGVTNDPDAERSILATTSNGNIEVRAAD